MSIMKRLQIVLACSLMLLPAGMAAANLLNNPGFETQGSTNSQASYWEWDVPDQHGSNWGTASREQWNLIFGSWMGAIRGTWAGAGNNGGYWQEVLATPGTRYRFTGWFYADGDGNQKKWTADAQGMKLEFSNSGGTLIAMAEQPILDAGPNWVFKSMEATAPANTAWIRVVIYADGVGPEGSLQFDDLDLSTVEEADTVSPGASSRRTGLVISEIMYHPVDDTLEYVELYNTTPFTNRLDGCRLSSAIDYVFPSSTVIPPFSYLVVAQNPAAVQTAYGITGVLGPYSNALPNGSGCIRLRKASGIADQGDAMLLEVNYSDEPPWPVAADGGGHSLVLSEASYGEDDSRAWASSATVGGTPGEAEPITESVYDSVVINEFLAHTDEPDWDFIELYNRSAASVNISGCMLSDTLNTNKFTIPDGTVISAGGRQVYFCITNPPSASPTNLTFNLSAKGEDVVFRAPDGRVVDVIRFSAQQNGVSSGRYPDGALDINELLTSTPGTANTALLIRDIVINEIMYNPVSGDDDDQYIELHNMGDSSVNIGHWRFESGIDFSFPAGTVIPADGYIVVAKNAAHLMSNYPGILNSGNTYGDFGGNLANSGERIALAKPDDPDFPDMDFVVVDEVTYHDGGQWGDWSDGDGSSLELMDPHSDNNQASSWADSDESSKGEWTLIESTGVLDNGMLPGGVSIDELHVVMQGRGQVQLDNVEVRQVLGSVEQGNRIANSTFESGTSGWTIDEGNVLQSSLAYEGYSSSRSLHIRATGAGDTGANRVKTGLTSSFNAGETAVLRARARWVCGGSHLLLRLRGNYLEAAGQVTVPKNLGTPARENSRLVSNTGPAIWDVRHDPVLPEAGEAVVVSARVRDPDGLSSVQLRYRLDPSSTTSTVTMTHAGGGLYTASIPGQAFGKIVAFRVFATDASSAVSRFPKVGSAGSRPGTGRECLIRFGDVVVPSGLDTLTLWMTEDNLSEWTERERHSNEYLDTTVICGGRRVIYDAAIRFRGSPWVRPHLADPENFEWRSSYRVEVPGDQAYLGVTEMNLDSMENGKDPTIQRERTCYQMAEQLGLPVSYQRYVFICMNGLQFPYAYADIHHVEGDYLETWYPDDSGGELFKTDDWVEYKSFDILDFVAQGASLSEFTTTGDALKKARYRWNWEKKSNGGYNDDYSSFLSLVEAANSPNDRYMRTVEALADVKQWMREIAFRHVIGDWDSFGSRRGKNAFIYRPTSGRFQVLPWDMDYGLTDTVESDYWDHDLFDVDTMDMVERMVNHPAFRRYYWQALNDAVQGPLLSTFINPMMDEVRAALLREGVAAGDASSPKSWVANRRNYIIGQLNGVTNVLFDITTGDFTTSSNLSIIAGTAPIQDVMLTLNGTPVQPTWSSVTQWSLNVVLTGGVNQLTMRGCDAAGTPISGHSDTIQITCNAAPEQPQDCLVINEIMYHPAAGGAGFIEIYNKSASTTFDLYRYKLDGVGFTFEQSTPILPGQYLVLASDGLGFIQTYGEEIALAGVWSGSLDNGGEWLRLQKLDALGGVEIEVDAVKYNDNPPWPAGADGLGMSLQLVDANEDHNRVGNWAVDGSTPSTPGVANSVTADLPAFPQVWINEIQPDNTGTLANAAGLYTPWLELYNADSGAFSCGDYYLTDDYDNLLKWAMPSINIGATGFQVIWADGAASAPPEYHAAFSLNPAGGNLALVHFSGGRSIIVDYMNYELIAEDSSYGCYPDGDRESRTKFYYVTPWASNNAAGAPARLYINEWLADNETGIVDPSTDGREDWFEIYNAEDYPVDITGYTLTDDIAVPTQWEVVGSTVLQPHEFRLVWADGDNLGANQWGTNVLFVNFGLSKNGEALALYDPAGEQVDYVAFGAQQTDVSQGRYPDGGVSITNLGLTTPGSPNVLDPNERIITVTSSAHGNINPAGYVTNQVGDSPSFSMTSDEFYVIGDVLTNGRSVGVVSGATNLTWVWTNVQASGTLHVRFDPVVTASGTPLYWLVDYDLTNGSPDAISLGDPDGDGVPTWKEYIAGTSPTDADSFFVAEIDGSSAATPTLCWLSIPNRFYTVYRSTNLVSGTPIILYNRMGPTPPQNEYTDQSNPGAGAYYWIKVEEE